jgi:hypothetical protein
MSRLSGDVNALVQPFNSMIPTMIASTANLIGGAVSVFRQKVTLEDAIRSHACCLKRTYV